MGEIPAEWDAPVLGELFTFKNGLNKAKEFFGFGTPIVNYMDVFEYSELRVDSLQGRVSLSKQELKSYDVMKGDVFFTRTSETVEEIGVAAVMLDEPRDTVFSGFVLRARPKNDSLCNQFKRYCFSSQEVRRQIVSKSTYTTRALTNGRSLSAVSLARPSKPEQELIAAALSDVDALISGLDQLIAKKRDIKQGALQQLLTGKTRLSGFRGEWEEANFGDIAKIRNEKINTYGSELATFCVELEQVGQGTGQITGHTDASSRQSSKYCFCQGDVLFGRLRSYLRKFWLSDRGGVCSTEIWPLTPSGKEVTPEYLFQIVQTESFIDVASNAYGTHMPRADWNVIKNHPVSLPNINEQSAIAGALSGMDTEMAALERRRDKTRALKQGMMQQLLTGRIRLI